MAAVAATSITLKAQAYEHGGVRQNWTLVLDPESIAAAAQEIQTAAIPGARAGDPCKISARVPEPALIVQSAYVTANNVVSIAMTNNITVTTALDSASLTYDLEILKLSTTPTIP